MGEEERLVVIRFGRDKYAAPAKRVSIAHPDMEQGCGMPRDG